ncbi:hypothetical protein DdX_17300 [Ditylenchus destructor]|uniref:Uncharacterized protein n=1 Tax=Ditylenchus destructor TaxID=166010 RepID=A0AAD4QZ45_9BILA|nr:hypothetical protein DdX_17300 [Ditylenchus destructor]
MSSLDLLPTTSETNLLSTHHDDTEESVGDQRIADKRQSFSGEVTFSRQQVHFNSAVELEDEFLEAGEAEALGSDYPENFEVHEAFELRNLNLSLDKESLIQKRKKPKNTKKAKGKITLGKSGKGKKRNSATVYYDALEEQECLEMGQKPRGSQQKMTSFFRYFLLPILKEK